MAGPAANERARSIAADTGAIAAAALRLRPRNIADWVRLGSAEFKRAGLLAGHHHDNLLDECLSLVLHALHLPASVPRHFAQARVTAAEAQAICSLLERRLRERIPAAYLIGEVEFAGLRFKTDSRALVPRSPLAEWIVEGHRHWLRGRDVRRVLDLCTGGGSIALAAAWHHPDWEVDAVDVSAEALSLAAENRRALGLQARVQLIESDLYAALADRRYELILSNPPYVSDPEYAAMAAEYAHEPRLGLTSGADGLDLPLQILRDAPAHLSEHGLLLIELGDSAARLRRLLPELQAETVMFQVGDMGILAIEAAELRRCHELLAAQCARRG